jgi:hypothetical protein
MSATEPCATSSLLPTVGVVSTDGPVLKSFDSDIVRKLGNFGKDVAVRCKSSCGTSSSQTFNKLDPGIDRIRSQYRLLLRKTLARRNT